MKALKIILSIGLCSFLATVGAVYAQTGQVVDLQGTATARIIPPVVAGQPSAAPGPARTLRLGDNINQGETISTGPQSRLALRFEDGQLVSLSANSSFKIETYIYNRAEPARSNVLFNLVNGGMRAVTGLIGKAKPDAVSYRAGNATIGIRGTDVSFAINGGNLIINVNTGQISFVPRPGAAAISVTVGNAALSQADGKVTVGSPAVIAAAIQAAITANPMQAAALGQLAAAVVAVSPPGSALATSVTAAVANSGNTAALNAFTTALPSADPNQQTTQTGPTTTSAGATTPSSSGSSGGGSLVPCTSVSPIRVPAGCNPPN